MKTYIYKLVDPRTGEARYVGKTVNPTERYQQHLDDTKSNDVKRAWISGLREAGLTPVMEVIEEVPDGEEWAAREKHWIAHGRAAGWPLVNVSHGGGGGAHLNARIAAAADKAIRLGYMKEQPQGTTAERLDALSHASDLAAQDFIAMVRKLQKGVPNG